jgi:tryptophan halogenase
MSDGRIRIVIVGGGTAGWMTAALMSRRLRAADYSVTLVESDEIGIVGVGEATLPHVKIFNDLLGLDEAEFMRATRATFKLGIEFRDWNRPGDRYIHPFGAFGEPWGGLEFQHHWLRAKRAGRQVAPVWDYSFAVAAAWANAFDFPDTDPASVRSTYSYAYHFDAGLYAEFLRGWATARGITRIEGKVVEVGRDGASGALRSITLQSGARIDGDLFVDCTGFRSLLLAGHLGAHWEDWADWLPCDRALAVPCANSGDFAPYTRSTARPAGWQWRIPLQHRVGNGYVFSSKFVSDEQARETLLANLESEALAEPRLLRFAPGRRVQTWVGNCVGIGLASGFLEPLESTSIFLIQAAAVDLVDLMPTPGMVKNGMNPALPAEFNRLSTMQYERIRDFLILHYVANSREGEPFWDYLRQMQIPDSLAHKLSLFRSRASLSLYQYGLFARDSWLAVLLGQGIAPEAYDRTADTFDLAMVGDRLDAFADRVARNVASMPSHASFLANYCKAPQ